MALQITLKDVAAKAGVSTSTACRALRSDPRISAATVAKVKQVAELVGYRPDPLLSALSFRRRNNGSTSGATTLAYVSNENRLLYEDIGEHAGDEPAMRYQEMCFEGAFSRARELGYNLEHFRINKDGLTPKRLNQILRARGIVGVCFAPIGDVRSAAMELDWSRFSAASIGVSLRNPPLHRSSTHHFHGMILCLERLLAAGYRKVGICLDEVTGYRIENMWLSAALLFGCQHPQMKLSIRGLPRIDVDDHVAQNFCRWFAEEQPDAVIAPLHAYDWLRDMKVKIPQQVGFAVLNYDAVSPQYAGVDQCTGKTAAAAVDLVVEQMHKCEYGIPESQRTVLIKGVWRDGQTLPPCSGKSDGAQAQIMPAIQSAGQSLDGITVGSLASQKG